MKVYIASSWKNTHQPQMVEMLRHHGHSCYDFRNPGTGGPVGPDTPMQEFSWKQCDPNYKDGDLLAYREMLKHPRAIKGFNADFDAMKWAQACVLVMPAGRSAHIEAGWMAGAGKKLVVYHPPARTKCMACEGTGYDNFMLGDHMRNTRCSRCDGGWAKTWNFEPELMYLVGGGPEVIATTFEEVLLGLKEIG